MSQQNKIFTTLNQPLQVQMYNLNTPLGAPQLFSTLDGVPLGTVNNAADGELGAKVIIIGGTLTTVPGGFPIPVSDDIVITYVGATNNIDTVTWFKDGNQVAVLQLSYVNGGAANDDLIDEAAFSLA